MTKYVSTWEHMCYAKDRQRRRHELTTISLIQRDKQHGKNWERLNKHQRIPKGQLQMDNPEKLGT